MRLRVHDPIVLHQPYLAQFIYHNILPFILNEWKNWTISKYWWIENDGRMLWRHQKIMMVYILSWEVNKKKKNEPTLRDADLTLLPDPKDTEWAPVNNNDNDIHKYSNTEHDIYNNHSHHHNHHHDNITNIAYCPSPPLNVPCCMAGICLGNLLCRPIKPRGKDLVKSDASCTGWLTADNTDAVVDFRLNH